MYADLMERWSSAISVRWFLYTSKQLLRSRETYQSSTMFVCLRTPDTTRPWPFPIDSSMPKSEARDRVWYFSPSWRHPLLPVLSKLALVGGWARIRPRFPWVCRGYFGVLPSRFSWFRCICLGMRYSLQILRCRLREEGRGVVASWVKHLSSCVFACACPFVPHRMHSYFSIHRLSIERPRDRVQSQTFEWHCKTGMAKPLPLVQQKQVTMDTLSESCGLLLNA